ncbi:MAG: hypothetical protein OEQ53_18455, partial [Saprospiraceae bacterium]|nr:hypothetical protein [Saprospiraceae bacterium]
YREGFYILLGLVQFFSVRSLLEKEWSLHTALYMVYGRLDILLQQDLAPALQREVIQFLWEIGGSETYQCYDPERNLWQIIFTFGSKDIKENCLEVLRARIDREETTLPEQLCFLRLLLQSGSHVEVKHLLGTRPYRFETLNAMLQTISDMKEIDLVYRISERLFSDETTADLKELAFGFLVRSSPNEDNQMDWYIRYFLEAGRESTYREARNLFTGQWHDVVLQIIQQLKKRGKDERLAFVYAMEGMDGALLDLIRSASSIEFVLQYAPYIYPDHHAVLATCIQEKLIDYLSRHVGYHSVTYVERAMRSMRNAGMHDVAHSIRRVLLREFGERLFLGKSLKIL